jgi:hypothetical protein
VRGGSSFVFRTAVKGEASFVFWNAVDPSLSRTHAFDGWPGKDTLGLRGAWKRSAMLCAELSALLRSYHAQKASDLPSWQIPLDVSVH